MEEELGVPLTGEELTWLSFGANAYLYEYGLIGRVDTPFTVEEIERRRALSAAKDSWETRRLYARRTLQHSRPGRPQLLHRRAGYVPVGG
jgi:hypothetical protein